MISNKELVDAFMRYRNFVRIKGDDNDIGPLLPLILLDMQLQIFDKSVRPVESTYEQAQFRNLWIRSYNLFNRGSFFAFKEEYRDRIIELMDDLGEYIDYNIMLLRVSVSDVLKDFAFEHQKVLSDCVVCNALIQIAQSWWRGTYKTARGKAETNPYIASMQRASVGFINAYTDRVVGFKGKIKLSQHPEVVNNANLLDKKITAWVARQGM